MIYRSCLLLRSASRDVQRDCRNPHDLHRTILRAFPPVLGNKPVRPALGLLYRLNGSRTLVVQSAIVPDWSELPHGYLADEPLVMRERVADLPLDRDLSFRLRANPTRRTEGKRVGLVTGDDLLDWLRRKGEAGGFTVRDVQATRSEITGRRSFHEPLMRWSSAEFAGTLRITDRARFDETIRHGVGSAKAYGFGLLLVGS